MTKFDKSTSGFSLMAAALTGAMMFMVPPAAAVHDLGIFEVEGNADEDGGVPPEDWETLYDGGANTGGASDSFTGIIPDPGQQSIFVGGRKDIQDIDEWGHKNDGGFPDKDDITNAYAAAYEVDGSKIGYFGADRFSNVGDAFIGYWFFAGDVRALPDGTFSGLHTDKDILVLANFPQGANASPEIMALQWDPSCNKAVKDAAPGQCGAKNLRVLADGNECNGTGDVACAITNDATEHAPWPFTSKNEDPAFPGDFPFESFFEGAIDLTQFAGETCFSSFMAETRSSKEPTATLKDFVISQFEDCGIEATKVCEDPILDAPANMITYTIAGLIINSGSGTLDTIMIDDSPFPVDAGSVMLFDIAGNPDLATLDTLSELQAAQGGVFDGTLSGGEAIIYEATITADVSNGFTDTVTISALPAVGGGSEVTAVAEANCPSFATNANMDVTKMCTVDLSDEGDFLSVVAEAMIEVCNLGTSELENVQLNDPQIEGAGGVLDGDLLPANTTLAPAGQAGDCVEITVPYSPADLPTGENGTFSNTVDATATTRSFANQALGTCTIDTVNDVIVCTDSAMAQCDLCPNPNP